MPEPDGKAVRDGGRRVGDLLPGGGEPAPHRRVQEKVPLHTQDTARSGMEGLFAEMPPSSHLCSDREALEKR